MGQIKIYNSQTQALEVFSPWEPPKVKMYCCGPTVYDLLHVGNFRGAVVYNFVRNFLELEGYQVSLVYNFTDVDDKIIDRAKKEGVAAEVISERYIGEFLKDFRRLGLREHTLNPKVTETMDDIIMFVQDLVDKGYAYVTPNGDVYFSIERFPEYGKLSHRKIEELKKGVRIEPNEQKKDPLDFALWKSAKSGEPSWTSPWGAGRPGWHIECSAMIFKHLGERIDIHGGGIDLLFPHHENEVAQSESRVNHPFVKYWMHNNLIQLDGVKMSKSLGNIISARDFFDQYHAEIYKYMILSSHYRSILNMGEEAIAQAIYNLSKIYSSLAKAEKVAEESVVSLKSRAFNIPLPEVFEKIWKDMVEAGRQDFNTALILSHFWEAIHHFNRSASAIRPVTPQSKELAKQFLTLAARIYHLMSILGEPAAEFLRFLDDWYLRANSLSREEIDNKVRLRSQLRQKKLFKEADQLRSELDKLKIKVHDYPDGSSDWEVDKSSD